MSGILCALPGVIKSAVAISRTAKTVTAVGNAQVDTARSKFGGASALFDGTGDYIQVVNDGEFDFGTGDFTIEWWQYLTSLDRWAIDMRSGSNGPKILIYSWPSDGSANELYYFVDSSNRISATSVISVDVWQHIAVSRSGTSTKMFVDGTQVGSTWTDNTDYNNGNLLIWENSLSTPFPTGLYNAPGNIDEFRISNIARYTGNFTPSTTAFTNDTNTLLLIHADGTDAQTVFTDDTGVRSPKGIQAIGNAQVDTAQSKFGGASALFDGSGDYLTVNPVGTDLYFPAGQDVTIEMFIRPNITQQFNPFFALGNARGASSGEVSLYIESFGGQFFLRMAYNFGAVLALTSAGGAVASNNWYHVAYTREGDVHRLFLDGALQETETDAGLNLGVSGQGFKVGSWADASGFYTGHVDEIRVSNIARYTAAFTAPTVAFVNDTNTLFLCHADGADAITRFTDDNA